MTAPNHALTGALIGLTVSNPLLALPLAFLSHFALDAIPHYDPPEQDKAKLFNSRRFFVEFLLIGALLCLALVLLLAWRRPEHWVVAAICAFLATSPDLFWIPRYRRARKGKTMPPTRNIFLRFHSWVQWKTGPKLVWLETAWFVSASVLLWHYL